MRRTEGGEGAAFRCVSAEEQTPADNPLRATGPMAPIRGRRNRFPDYSANYPRLPTTASSTAAAQVTS